MEVMLLARLARLRVKLVGTKKHTSDLDMLMSQWHSS